MQCLASGAADYWVKPLRLNEVRVLWTRLWRQVGSRACVGREPRAARLLALRCPCSTTDPQHDRRRLPACQLSRRRPLAGPCAAASSPPAACPPLAPAHCLQPPAKPLDDSSSGNSTDAAAK